MQCTVVKIRRGPKLEGYALANFGYSSGTEWESRHEIGNSCSVSFKRPVLTPGSIARVQDHLNNVLFELGCFAPVNMHSGPLALWTFCPNTLLYQCSYCAV